MFIKIKFSTTGSEIKGEGEVEMGGRRKKGKEIPIRIGEGDESNGQKVSKGITLDKILGTFERIYKTQTNESTTIFLGPVKLYDVWKATLKEIGFSVSPEEILDLYKNLIGGKVKTVDNILYIVMSPVAYIMTELISNFNQYLTEVYKKAETIKKPENVAESDISILKEVWKYVSNTLKIADKIEFAIRKILKSYDLLK